MSMLDPDAELEITGFEWVPPFAVGLVRDLRPRWACEEAGLPYRERLISAIERPDWYFAEQPWGQVPVIRDGDIRVFESGATLLHIAEKTGQLLPAGGQARADALSWLLAAFNSVEPRLLQWVDVTLFSAREDWAKLRQPSLEEAIGKRLEPVARIVAEREWLAGEFSIADIAMSTVLRPLRKGPLLTQHEALLAYTERAEARPAFQTALSDQVSHYDANAPQTEGA
jgi:glutathione S-transferase